MAAVRPFGKTAGAGAGQATRERAAQVGPTLTSSARRVRVSLDVVGKAGETLVVVFNGSGNTPDAYTSVLTVGSC